MCYDDFEQDYADQDRRKRRYQQQLDRHHDPRDPDYPGDMQEGEDDE